MALALDLGTLNKRLKREGAASGDITASLIWNDRTDLDLHCHIKQSSKEHHIYFGNKKAANGHLDVDMNAGSKISLEPVENIFFKNPVGGKYEFSVKNFTHRSDNAKVPFKVFLNKDGEMKTFSGEVAANKTVSCFKFSVDGDEGTGGGGNFVVLPPSAGKATFKDLTGDNGITWKVGCGYYAVARSEKIHAGKEMLLQDVDNMKFTVGRNSVLAKLGWPDSELKKSPKDVPAGHRLYVQSTSYNRVIPPGTHVLFEVTAEEYAKHQKTRGVKDESHTMGKGGGAEKPPKAKAKAKAAGRAAPAKAKAKAAGRAAAGKAKAKAAGRSAAGKAKAKAGGKAGAKKRARA